MMGNEEYVPKKIVVVGGGTAAWMAVNLLVSKWADADICVVESKSIGIIGVGEGSTPHLKLFFDAINLPDEQWMPHCNATYKNGIMFEGWSKIPGYESYFHPFAAQTDDIFTVPLFFKNIQARMQGHGVSAHPDPYFLETHLSEHNLGPLPDESFPFGVAYGYHFDSKLLGQFLATHAIKKGISRVFGKVVEVELHQSGQQEGDISAIKLSDNTRIEADFFVDCSGFDSLLMQKALKVEYKSYADQLVNDAAVVLPNDVSDSLPVATKATALTNGWAWKIPLTNRYGNGYVYSTRYIDADNAETELRQHLHLLDSSLDAKHLTMKVGRVQKHWHKNCLAVGLSQGFIEPLEATAIALSFNTVAQFIECFSKGEGSKQYQDAFNQDINARFDGIRDYVLCHYKANQRKDTNYWNDCAENNNIPDTLNHVLHLWQEGHNFAEQMQKYNLTTAYQAKSWACMLAGYGVFPKRKSNSGMDYSAHKQENDDLYDFIRRCALNFKKHKVLLSQ